MLLTTALLYRLMRERWKWPIAASAAVSGIFLAIDLAFFGANLLKIAEGGWNLTGSRRRHLHHHDDLARRGAGGTAAPGNDLDSAGDVPTPARREGVARAPGTAVFLTRMTGKVPPQMVRHLRAISCLAGNADRADRQLRQPPAGAAARPVGQCRRCSQAIRGITIDYGFVEMPNLPLALKGAKARGCPADFAKAVYIAAPDRVIRDRSSRHLWRWQLPLFSFLFRNAVHAVDRFNLPPENFVEIGREIEILRRSPLTRPLPVRAARISGSCRSRSSAAGRTRHVRGALKRARCSRQKAMISAASAPAPCFSVDEGAGRFAPFRVGPRDDRGFEHRRMAVEHVLDLDRRDVLAARDDDVLRAVLDLDIAVGVGDREIAGMEPAAGEGLLGRGRVLQIALHDDVAAHEDLAHRLAVAPAPARASPGRRPSALRAPDR